METVLRALGVYLFLLLVFRLSGKRSLAHITTFDFVLLLLIAEASQQALVGQDFSVVNAMLAIATLAVADIGLSMLKERSPRLERLIDDMPVIIVDHGRLLSERIKRERIDEADILAAARKLHGLERLDQVKYAVLEVGGGISIVPYR
ncbi:MAG: DUF421 domain-containing protein [Panacagrimonas sp.]